MAIVRKIIACNSSRQLAVEGVDASETEATLGRARGRVGAWIGGRGRWAMAAQYGGGAGASWRIQGLYRG